MQDYTLIAPAKINLHLEIVGARPDGYHELVMVMQNVALADRVRVRAGDRQEIRLFCNHPQVPKEPTANLAYKAAKLMCDRFSDAYARLGGVDITIEKNIPVAAGLAGGSVDAAAVLVGIDLLWKLGLTKAELQDLGAELGSDVPFCVLGGTALATGRGEVLDPLPDLNGIAVVLAKHRNLEVSTGWAYKSYREAFGQEYLSDPNDIAARHSRVHSGPLAGAIVKGDAIEIGKLLYNDLERVVLPAHTRVEQVRSAFAAAGVLGTMMSGSGPTVFALCKSTEQARQVRETVQEQIADPELDFWVTQLSGTGICVEP
ncbi:MAG: 4-(cytidine 5'-diphospho)-2-C-methyl-D-erythritol kinase [Cyanobacteria bacterium J06641_5]